MRRLVITENMTLDGSVEMLDNWFDPQLQDDELLAESHRQDAAADALLVGRRTFEDFRGYWPAQTDDTTGVTDYLNLVAKYVVSSTLDDPRWQNSTVLRGDPADAVRALKQRPGKRLIERPLAFRSGIVLLKYSTRADGAKIGAWTSSIQSGIKAGTGPSVTRP